MMLVICCTGTAVAQNTDNLNPVAVIELFTSEGCSSCPPADNLLAETVKNAAANNQKIFALAFHVDYWNRLGWKDSFSTADFSQRQNMYVNAMHLNGAYTPQMIVNGNSEFVGSDKAALDKALEKALHQKSGACFTVLNAVVSGQSIHITYALSGDIKQNMVNLALVSVHELTAVKRGENSGKQLHHTNVVRLFTSTEATATGHFEWNSNLALQPDKYIVIAYLQQKNGLNITGATSTKLLKQ